MGCRRGSSSRLHDRAWTDTHPHACWLAAHRAFKSDGSLYYPVRKSASQASRLPNRPIHPYWLSGALAPLVHCEPACDGAGWRCMHAASLPGRGAAGFFPKDEEGNSLAMMVVNGKTWPRVVGAACWVAAAVYHRPAATCCSSCTAWGELTAMHLDPTPSFMQSVARSAYRLRLLNGCNSRTLKVSFRCGPPPCQQPLRQQPTCNVLMGRRRCNTPFDHVQRPVTRSLTPPDATGRDTRPRNEERLPFAVVGTEAGFLTTPAQRDQLLMGNGDRFDVIFDFSSEWRPCFEWALAPARAE